MELWDLVDSNRNKIGKKHFRGNKLFPGEYHEAVHIWFKSSEGKYLVQQRSFSKNIGPGGWAITGGAIVAGETSIIGAIREVKEEIGVKLTEDDLNLMFVCEPCENSNAFSDVYLVEKDIDIESCILDKDEVEKVAYLSKDEIFKMVDVGIFYNYGINYFKTVFGED